jgi:hypothetical protein
VLVRTITLIYRNVNLNRIGWMQLHSMCLQLYPVRVRVRESQRLPTSLRWRSSWIATSSSETRNVYERWHEIRQLVSP